MKVILFGATGMVGREVLPECLSDPAVEQILVVGRTSVGEQPAKVREILLPDLGDLSTIKNELTGYNACFYCLGVSSTGMSEAAHRKITYDLTVAAGTTLARLNPDMTFVYVSGAGTDSSEHGRVRWARIKGATENALLAMPLRTYLLRHGYSRAAHGVKSKTRRYSLLYTLTTPLYHLLKHAFPRHLLTTEQIARCMIRLAAAGGGKPILESPDSYTATTV
jgi:uncharacterized protein YbjT (DUF2867 family)